jgi:TolB-like protein/Tfp pilus assembly protein PilF
LAWSTTDRGAGGAVITASRRRPGIAIVASAAVLLAVLAITFPDQWRQWLPARTPVALASSLAVLPLTNMSGDPDQDYFADGMTAALIDNLGKIHALQVKSKTSVMRFKDTDVALPEIADALGVDVLVEGSVARIANRVAVTARLIDGARDQLLWSKTYEHDVRDVLALRNEVAGAIAAEIRIELTPDERVQLTRARPVDPQVYEAYMRGRFATTNEWTHASASKAIEFFQKAVDLDDTFAPAYVGIAFAYSSITSGYSPEEVLEKGKPAALRALELDDSLGSAYGALAEINFVYEQDWASPEQDYARGLMLSPNSIEIRISYTNYLILNGRFEEGIANARRALAIDPLTPTTSLSLGWSYMLAGRYDEAIEQHQHTLELLEEFPNPTTKWWVGYQLAMDYFGNEMYDEALIKAEEVGLFYERIWILYRMGRRDEALQLLRDHEAAEQGQDPISMAAIYALIGDDDSAFQWLEEAYEMNHPMNTWLKVHPLFDPIRSDPRFNELLERVGIPVS